MVCRNRRRSLESGKEPSGEAVLKGELIDLHTWPTRAMARRAVVEYIGWYNGARLHSTLDYRSLPRDEELDRRCEG
jgi:transposase InsO family protein